MKRREGKALHCERRTWTNTGNCEWLQPSRAILWDIWLTPLCLASKAAASTQAVDERKELEARKRELKKLTDALNAAKENLAATESQQNKLQDEVSILQERQSSASCDLDHSRLRVNYFAHRLKRKSRISGRRCKRKEQNSTRYKEIHRESSELSGIGRPIDHLIHLTVSRLETEANERLQEALNQLLAAGVHKRENDSRAKLRETVSNLKRIFPGR